MFFPEGLENTPLNWKKLLGFRNLQEKLENNQFFLHNSNSIVFSIAQITKITFVIYQ